MNMINTLIHSSPISSLYFLPLFCWSVPNSLVSFLLYHCHRSHELLFLAYCSAYQLFSQPIFPLVAYTLSCHFCSYLTRLTDSLLHHLKLSRKAAAQVEVFFSRVEEATSQQSILEPQLTAVVKETKRLQKLVCQHHTH